MRLLVSNHCTYINNSTKIKVEFNNSRTKVKLWFNTDFRQGFISHN